MNNPERVFIVAIDGPGGSGKGTIGQRLASHYGWHYLDSGALYRVFAYAAVERGINRSDTTVLGQLVNDLQIRFIPSIDGGSDVELNGVNVTDYIRSEQAGKQASAYAAVPEVREALFQLQKSSAKAPGLVADGRDMGSVVFPQADVKIFLTASAESRAKRRYKQLNLKGFDVNLTRLVEDIQLRDRQDVNREHSPLVPTEDATILDTTSMSIDEVFSEIVSIIDRKVAAVPL